MATAYHRDDAGGLVLSYGTSTDTYAFAAFKTILKSCLVTGYGSKAAAGWGLIAEGSSYLVLRNGSHSGYVCFTQHSMGYVTVYVAETYTGMSGNVMTGDGLKTGLSANNAIPQRFPVYYIAQYTGTTTWYMVADEKSFVLQCATAGSSTGAADLDSASSNTSPSIYVGEDSAGNFIVVGGQNTTSTNSAIYPAFDASGFTSLRDPQTGLLVSTGSLVVDTPGVKVDSESGSKVIQMQKAYLTPMIWAAGAVEAGRLRGVALCQAFGWRTAGHCAKSIGFSGTFSSRSANTPISLGDGYTYFVSTFYSTVRLLTDNPEFW